MGRRKDGRPRSNPEMAAFFQELRRSSAASPHEDARTKRRRTRQTQIDAELKDEDYDDSED